MEKGAIRLYDKNGIEFSSESDKVLHRHNCYEISWLIFGSGEYVKDGNSQELLSGDMVVFNPFEVHSIEVRKHSMLAQAFIVGHFFLDELGEKEQAMPEFICAPKYINKKNKGNYDKLKLAAARMFLAHSQKEDYWQIEEKLYLYKVMHLLLQSFVGVKKAQNANKGRWGWEVLQYIHNHLQEPISLPSISDVFFMSPSYFSKMFKEKIGISPVKYIAKERVQIAAEKLITTEETITDIALSCGFNSIKTFEATFLNEFGVSPAKYRKSADKRSSQKESHNNEKNELAIVEAIDLRIHQLEGKTTPVVPVQRLEVVPQVTVDMSKQSAEMSDSWRCMVNVGNASDILDADIQNRLIQVQNEIHFRYIHFHGIFDDTMRVYNEDLKGRPILTFGFVDKILDFILEVGLKPYIELSFMPGQLASVPRREFNGYHSKPKSQKNWNLLLARFLEHCMERYSRQEVESWMFQIWDSAFLSGWWNDSMEDFCVFYRESYETLRKISGRLRIGMPSVNTIALKETKWLETFLKYTIRHDCTPDFISLSVYPHNEMSMETKIDTQRQMLIMDGDVTQGFMATLYPFAISGDVDYMKNRLELLQSKLAKMNLTGLPIYITQWNSNNIPGFLPRDCVQNAAYIVKNICDNYPVVESFGYWILSDEKEEYFANNVPFHGGMGLISNFGFKMPGYHAMEFFAKMRGKLLYRQDGIFITKDQDDVYALLYHYIHFRANVCENNAFNERYRYFEDRPSKTISIVFDGLQEGNYMISEHIINQEYASCFDIWVNMGGPDHLTREDVQYINDMNRPARNISYQKIAGKWELNRVLKRFEVRLVILKCQK